MHGFAVRGLSLFDLSFGGVGGTSKPFQGTAAAGKQALDLGAEQTRPTGLGLGVERGDHFVNGPNSYQAVAAHQVVVQEAQRQTGDESVYPHGQPGQLHGDKVHIDAIDATPGHLTAQQGGVRHIELAIGVGQRVLGGLAQPGQLGAHAGHGIGGEPLRQPGLDAVEGGGEEVAGAHGDVSAAEVEEGLGQLGLVARLAQSVEPVDVGIEGGFEGFFEQVLHREGGGEVAAGGLANPGAVAEVDLPGGDGHRLAGLGWPVLAGAFLGQVRLSGHHVGLEQPLVDGAELSHRQRSEVHRPDALGGVVDEQRLQGRFQLGVADAEVGQSGPGPADAGVGREEPAVVGRHSPCLLAPVDNLPELGDVVPPVARLGVGVGQLSGVAGVDDLFGDLRQRMGCVAAVGGDRQQAFVFGVGHEKQPEQDGHHLFVRGLEVFAGRVRGHPSGDGGGQRRDGVVVNPLAQPHGEVGCVALRGVERLLHGAVRGQGGGREDQGQVSGRVGGQQGQVQLQVGLSPALAAHAGVEPGRVQADLGAPGGDHPGNTLLVGQGEGVGHGRVAVELAGGRLEGVGFGAEHRHRLAAPVGGEHRGARGQRFDRVAERLDQIAAPLGQHGVGGGGGVGPIRAGGEVPAEDVGGEQALVAHSRQGQAVEFAEGGAQQPDGGVVVGLVEGGGADAPGHGRLDVVVDRGLFAVGAAEHHFLDGVGEIANGDQHRAGPVPPPGPMGPANRGGRRPRGSLTAEDLKPVRPRAGVQRRVLRPQLSREVVSKPRSARLPTEKHFVEPAHSGETLATPCVKLPPGGRRGWSQSAPPPLPWLPQAPTTQGDTARPGLTQLVEWHFC